MGIDHLAEFAADVVADCDLADDVEEVIDHSEAIFRTTSR
jgi:hypothetical protein